MTICTVLGKQLLHLLFLGLLLAVCGCEGTETPEKVSNAVEAPTGIKDVDRYSQIKKNLDGINSRQAEKRQQLDDDRENQ